MSREAPPLLYKYTDLGDWFSSFLMGSSLKFSSRRDFNDPFDTNPSYQVSAQTVTDRRYIQTRLREETRLSPAKRLLLAQAIKNHGRVARHFTDPTIEQMLDTMGIFSLTTGWENPLLWSHYAAHHNGVCVGFRSDEGVFATALPVTYRDKLPVIRRPGDDDDAVLEKTLLTKARCWEYEDEWRIIKRKMTEKEKEIFGANSLLPKAHMKILADQNGPGLYDFHNSSIESITLGMRVSSDGERMVKNALDSAGLEINLYRINKPHLDYKLTRALLRR